MQRSFVHKRAKYKKHEYALVLYGNWWNITVDDDPCLETFDNCYAAESAAKSIIDDLENSRFEPTIRGFPVSMLSSHPFIQDLTQVVPELKTLIHEDALIGVHFPAQSSAVFTFKQSANTKAVATKLINLGYSVSIA